MPDAEGYDFSPQQIDYIGQNNQTILKLIRDLQRDQQVIYNYQTNYIDLPYDKMFHTGIGHATMPTRLVSSQTNVAPAGNPTISYLITREPTGGWIATWWGTALETSVWHIMFMLPANYAAGSNLICTFNAINLRLAVAAEPTTHKVGMSAYRDTNTEGGDGQGLFGYNASTFPTTGTFVWNKDICLTAEQKVEAVTVVNMYKMAYTLSFTIDGDDNDYPLAPGRIILLTWTSTTQSSDANENRSKFSKFYVAYSGG